MSDSSWLERAAKTERRRKQIADITRQVRVEHPEVLEQMDDLTFRRGVTNLLDVIESSLASRDDQT
jgi:hypothetical protein